MRVCEGVAACAICLVTSAFSLTAQTPADLRARAGEVMNEIVAGNFKKESRDAVQLHDGCGSPSRSPCAGLGAIDCPSRRVQGHCTGQFSANARIAGRDVRSAFQRATLDAIIVFGSDGRIAGLRFVPHQEVTGWTPPTYAHPDAFSERPVTVAFRSISESTRHSHCP